jgi:HEPN domain-containing protein
VDEEAKAWLTKAEEDLLGAKRLAEDAVLLGLSAFHAQQAIKNA